MENRTQPEQFFRFQTPSEPWGDYGQILRAGLAERDSHGHVILDRTGPWTPPIFTPGLDIILCTDEGRALLKESELQGLTFEPARLRRAVRVDWQEWMHENEPRYYPESGEPLDYVEAGRHDKRLASAMPKFFEIRLPQGIREIRSKDRRGSTQILLQSSSWTGSAMFQGDLTPFLYCSARGRKILEQLFKNHLEYSLAKPTPE